MLAAVLLSVAAVTGYLDATSAAQDFVDGPQTAARADDLAGDLSSTVTKAIGSAGGLCLGLTYLLLSLNAMRAGLLSRFMGILGIIAGVLVVIPILPRRLHPAVLDRRARACSSWAGGPTAAAPRGTSWSRSRGRRPPTSRPPARRRAESEQPEPEPEPEGDEQPGQEPRRRPASRKKKRRGGH